MGMDVIDGHGTAMFPQPLLRPKLRKPPKKNSRVWITAIRDIAAGEELVYDYHLYDGDPNDAPCHCGSANCKGTMFSAAEEEK